MKFRLNIIMLLTGIILASCNNNGNKELSGDLVNNPVSAEGKATANSEEPRFEFDKESHDFGRVYQGEKISYSFKFRNTGKLDLLIYEVKASCGCTVPEYPKKPVKAGEEAFIQVTFNTEGKSGLQTKSLTIVSNTNPNTKILTIKADIIN